MAEREGYLEWVAPGAVTPETWLPGGDLPLLPPGTRVLLDATGVREVTVPAENFAAAAQQLHRMGVRVALLAGSPLVFGLGRQAVQLAGLPEGVAFAVFMERDEALRWLLGARGQH